MHSRRKYSFQTASASSLFEILEFESTDEGNPFQFHDFFQIYTSAVQRFHEKTKQRTPTRWPEMVRVCGIFTKYLSEQFITKISKPFIF